MKLARMQYHVAFTDIVVKVLRCVCFFCSRLLLVKTAPAVTVRPGKATLTATSNRSKSKSRCPHCHGPQPGYARTGGTVQMDFPTDTEFASDEERAFATAPFTADSAHSIMRNITDTDCITIGMSPERSRPENMVISTLIVPPVCIRPSVAVSDSSRSRGQDDLTLKLQDICKANTMLGAATTDAERRKAEDLLILHLSLYFDKDTRNKAGNRGRSAPRTGPCRSLAQRLKGKKGRVRGNLMGKRVDQSARSVIGPDSYIDLDEVGVPDCIARSQSFPERVTRHNRAWLRKLVDAGHAALVGAHRVQQPDGRMVSLSMVQDRTTVPLPIGAVVHRHLIDGDYVIMNRQPSLHKESMMAHRVRVFSGNKTLLLPVLDTPPYNADFDGDEMNLHTPQTQEARAEAAVLMSVTANILSPQACKPCISAVQDALLGAWLLTARDTFLTEAQFMDYTMGIHYSDHPLPTPAILKPVRLYTGCQLMSAMLPERLVIRRGHPWAEDGLWISGGHLHIGRMNKKTIGTSQGGIVHTICVDLREGDQRCMEFLSDLQRTIAVYLQARGFSIGVGDCMVTPRVHDHVSRVIERACDHIKRVESVLRDPFEREVVASSVLQSVLDATGRIVLAEMNPNDNSMCAIVTAGSKGSNVNISQVMACIGQVTVGASRIKHPRVLPSFREDEGHPIAKGFCSNPFITGLTPEEFFLHAMGGREGLVDTAVKTAQTG
jgi:DNA-directed RNA polymerase II subunit RPB1